MCLPRGITPACAGITTDVQISLTKMEDHPRVCGNYQERSELIGRWGGSPPRVRELLVWCDTDGDCDGITPACAGITLENHHAQHDSQDHPRVCGNYSSWQAVYLGLLGSPPRVRELLLSFAAERGTRGITPACAGITTLKKPSLTGLRDHPRVCGNYPTPRRRGLTPRGSPPRVRELLTITCG